MIWDAVNISLKVVLASTFISFFLSLALVIRNEKKKRKGISIIEYIVFFPMFIPPSALGYLVLVACGKESFIGRFVFEVFGTNIIFTKIAAVIVGVIVATPIMYQSIKLAFSEVSIELRDAARDCGASELQVYRKIVVPLAFKGILSGVILSFSRAFGEFGATVIVAGNIRGKTQTLSMAMYDAIENNNELVAIKIFLILITIAIFLMTINTYITKTVKKDGGVT